MNTEAMKMHLEEVDKRFSELKKNPMNRTALDIICIELGKIFPGKYSMSILNLASSEPLNIMSVYPEQSTLAKITESIIKEEDPRVIKVLWDKNTTWVIEVDRRIIDDSIVPLSSRELTALLLHEIGHVKYSNSIPARISRVVKYQYATMSSKVKSVLRSASYRGMLALPIIDASSIQSSLTPSGGINKELGADKFASNLGYGKELASAIDKIVALSSKHKVSSDDGMSRVLKFVTSSVDDLITRRGKLAFEAFTELKNEISSPYAESAIDSILRSMENMYVESASEIVESWETEEYFCEFFGLKKKLKPIKPYDLDYAAVEVEKIRTYNDKLLIMSYIRSKIDMIDYYISILENDRFTKKYEVPHSKEYLVSYKDKLLKLLRQATATEITDPQYGLAVQYPAGYEG